MSGKTAILYAFWASSCSWRVRAALTIKGVSFEERNVDIVKDQHQFTDEFTAINPSRKVPALLIDGETLIESMAIIQYLEDTRPAPALSPSNALLKARMREICEIIVSGIQPLQNVGLRQHFENTEQYQKFTKYWTEQGILTLEELLTSKKSSGRYCIGDEISMADICLVPQIYNAVLRYKFDLNRCPTVLKIYETLLDEKVFQQTHPKITKSTSAK